MPIRPFKSSKHPLHSLGCDSPWVRRLILVLPALLAACGGGSDSGSASNQSTAPLPSPSAVATPAPAESVVAGSAASASTANADTSCGLNAPAGIQAEILQRINSFRASGAVCGTLPYPAAGPLTWNPTLLQAAKEHAADMAAKNYFDHTGLDGRSPAQRVLAAGYNYARMGENIAAGQASVEAAMAAWIGSPGHCQNMMTPEFRDIAVACVRNDAATYRIYWVMEMGRAL
jgi:uncharacterized protein YkwD